jgi:hypothetical protein
MTEHDLAILHDWLNRPHVVEWWGGEAERPSLAEVLEHYLPRVMAEESVTPYIAMLGEEPIGYAQSYVALGSGDGWWEDETDPGVRGIDQFLANPNQQGPWNKSCQVARRAAILGTDCLKDSNRSSTEQLSGDPLLRKG